MSNTVLRIEDLYVTYSTSEGLVNAVRGMNLHLQEHETYGFVGESGSGKSTLAFAIMHCLADNGRIASGRIFLKDEDLLSKQDDELRRIWGARMAMVYQNPGSSLNPAMTIGQQILEVIKTHFTKSREERRDLVLHILEQVRIPDPQLIVHRYPHQLSGGMQQRILIAMALCTSPELLILDEPTTNLDVTTEAAILDLISELKEKYDSTILYITHNLGVIARICDRVGVMYAGELVEEAPVKELFTNPSHVYTQLLLRCIPRLEDDDRGRLACITGRIPAMSNLQPGCIFRARCPIAMTDCKQNIRNKIQISPDHWTTCLQWNESEKIREIVNANLSQKFGVSLSERDHPPLLEVRELKKYFSTGTGSLFSIKGKRFVKALDGVSITVSTGYALGLVGESGCGKTTLARCIAGLIEASEGHIRYINKDIPLRIDHRTKDLQREMQMVFQNPEASLNPYHNINEIIERPLLLLSKIPHDKLREKVIEILQSVNLDATYGTRYPNELSGGEKQRVAIARAFACNPALIICDEPVSSLDVSVQASVLNLLADLSESTNVSLLFISHDLSVVRHLCDSIGVLYLGQLCEIGKTDEIFSPPFHPYTEALLSAIPVPNPETRQKRIDLKGGITSAINLPKGCRFHPRCPKKIGSICETKEPSWLEITKTHLIKCHLTQFDLTKTSLIDVESIEC